jgi:phosphopantetheine--protein transferase-like protein
MEVKVGTDILHLQKFKKTFLRYPHKWKRDIFSKSELTDARTEHLAGIFAAKEAIMKALDIKPGHWKLIEVKRRSSGKPFVALSPKIAKKDITRTNYGSIVSADVSISHHGDYVLAVAVFLIQDEVPEN